MLPDGANKNHQRGVTQLFDQMIEDMRKRLQRVSLADLMPGKGRKRKTSASR
jgi:DNA-binding IscR family transcriptional regulator